MACSFPELIPTYQLNGKKASQTGEDESLEGLIDRVNARFYIKQPVLTASEEGMSLVSSVCFKVEIGDDL